MGLRRVQGPRPELNNLVAFGPPSRRPIGGVTTFSSEVRMVSIFPTRCPLWLAPVALILAACDGTAPPASHPLSLSVTTKGTSGVSVPARAGMNAAIQIGSGPNPPTITQAQVGAAR